MRYLLRNNLVDDFVPYGVYMRYVAGLSFFNSATLMVQRRGVGYAATETTWLKRFGRVIKPGANPLIIMKPFAPLDLFYEACDTYSPDGEPLPEWIAEKLANVPPVPTKPFAFDHAAAVQVLNNHGVFYDEREMGERAGGIIKYTEAPLLLNVYYKKNLEYIQTHYSMVVNAKKSLEEKAAAIFHEIGHLLCGYLPQDEELKKIDWLKLSTPKRDISNLSLAQKEYEAETACMLLLRQ